MYAGFLTDRHTSSWLGSHQKFNRMAHRLLMQGYMKDEKFPTIKEIQSFEGLNGPDGLKVKSPAQHEPNHFIDPDNPDDRELLDLITNHAKAFRKAVKDDNMERLAFESAWLAHAITDGLTPAHHYPFHAHLEQIRGEPAETRINYRKKVFAKGGNRRDTLLKNWKLWGNKGVLLTHYNFEIGIATVLIPMRYRSVSLSAEEIEHARNLGFEKYFREQLNQIAALHMYSRFFKTGWSTALAQDAKKVLVPIIARTVALAWLLNYEKAKK